MAIGARRGSTLDRISMGEWLRRERLDVPRLKWYVDYACRDDYGASLRQTSAWAGIHYFAAREPDERGPLTWPDGNGWITKRLLAKLGGYVETNAPVSRVRREGSRWRLTSSAKARESRRWAYCRSSSRSLMRHPIYIMVAEAGKL